MNILKKIEVKLTPVVNGVKKVIKFLKDSVNVMKKD